MRTKALKSVLRELNASSSDIEASACISSVGFNLASALNNDEDPDRYSAICVSFLADKSYCKGSPARQFETRAS